MPHVNQLIDKYGKQGFTVLFVTDGPDAPTEKFVEETKLKAPVVWEKPLKSMDDFGFGGYPSSVLVAPNGKIVWTSLEGGGLSEKMIEEHLLGIVLMPPAEKIMIDVDLPKKNAAIAKHFATGKIGEGWNALTTAIAAKEIKEDDKTKLEAAQTEVDKLVKEEVASAEKYFADKRYFDSQTQWKRVSAACKGRPTGKTADDKLAELGKDANLKKELDAGARIAEAHKLSMQGKTKPAIAILNSVVDGPFKDTEEAKRAKGMAEELKKA